MNVEMRALWTQKDGNARSEYEDAVSYHEGFSPSVARAAVADGVSTAFDSQTWANLLVRRFVDADGPDLEPASFEKWVSTVRAEWRESSATPVDADSIYSLYEVERACEGTSGTFLGLELGGLSGEGLGSWWRAVAIGDTVLFHVRADVLVGQVPAMSASEFSRAPYLLESEPDERLDPAALTWGSGGPIADTDVLLVATDALGAWMLGRHEAGTPVWDVLANIDAPAFRELVAALRESQELVNDDVTLLVVHLAAEPAELAGGRT